MTGCHELQEIQDVQPFPTTGMLGKNLNQPLSVLFSRIRNVEARAYSYVVRTVMLNRETTTFEQRGSAPNFQGDVLTLCTCKHQMRSSQPADDWKDVWVAGFTNRVRLDGKHWLFYLAQIESSYGSHCDLWTSLNEESRNAKAAHENYLGDVFQPKRPNPTKEARFLPSRYIVPTVHAHRQKPSDRGWQNDIKYRHADKFRHPPLLVAKPRMTFLWDEPMIFLKEKHCRNYFKWQSLNELMALLSQVGQ